MKDSTIWVGIDDHADSMKVSVFGSDRGEAEERFELVPDERGLRQMARRLKARAAEVRCVLRGRAVRLRALPIFARAWDRLRCGGASADTAAARSEGQDRWA